jgi:hemolysin D
VKQAAAANALAVETRILNDIEPLAAAGGISRIQLLKQQQIKDQKQAEVDEYAQERIRIEATIAQAQARVQNTQAVDTKEFTGRIGENTQQLAAIDAQITKVIVENNKRIAEIDSQISQSQQILQYGEVKAPVSGLVFNLKPNAVGYVASPNTPIVTIVPTDQLIAKVAISNKDIGFVRETQEVDVRIDAFPFSEFGDVKGTVLAIGSDALPPTETQPFYIFPAKIKLNQQTINVNGKVTQLQPGMSVSANVRLRQRTVISIFTDMFTKTAESMKLVR